jgi:cytochrome bd ubiquinol oxidase subunit II
MNAEHLLPIVFMALMGLSMLIYVVLDGYDLGVGMLLQQAPDRADQDMMVASIGPFWDANETWLVLGAGILLIAFPKAHGVILTELYLPVALMLIGLTLRGVAFELRAKAPLGQQARWNQAFMAGSTLAAASQGWMLGHYITGLHNDWQHQAFALAIAVTLPSAYVLLGAGWLIMKTEGALQKNAVRWAKQAWWPVVLGMGLISVATPWVSHTVRERWFSMPAFIALLPIPLMTLAALVLLRRTLNWRRVLGDLCWIPFALVVSVFILGFFGLAYSLYPFVLIDQLTLWQAASATSSLKMILIGVSVTVPMILGYTVFSYRVFWGKARALSYG